MCLVASSIASFFKIFNSGSKLLKSTSSNVGPRRGSLKFNKLQRYSSKNQSERMRCKQTAIFFFKSCILYSLEQKHMLLFRKSKILLFKVSISNMPLIFFLGTKLFCFSSILLIQDFMKAHLDNFYFSQPMLLIELNSVTNKGCH